MCGITRCLSYLTEISQCMIFGGCQLNCENIDVDVPQGSILEHLLFLIYNFDSQNNTSLQILNFADDMLLYTTLKQTHIYRTVTSLI